MIQNFLKCLLNKNNYFIAKSEGLIPNWFQDENTILFLRFLDNYYEIGSNNPHDFFLKSADLYIADDTNRSSFLSFFDDVMESEENISEFKVNLLFYKKQYLSQILTKDIQPLLNAIKNNDYEKSVSIIKKLSLDVSSTVSSRIIGDIRDVNLHEQSMEIKSGLKIGYDCIDSSTGGFKPGQLIIFVSGPGEGKSTILLNIAYNLFMSGKNVLFFSCEMPMNECVKRFSSRHTGIPYSKLDTHNLSKEEKMKYKKGVEDFRNFSNYVKIVDENLPDIFTIEAEVSRLEKKPDLIIVDYLALVKNVKSYKNKWESIEDVALGLRNISRNYGIPLITAAQINREGLESKNDFYKSHHLSGSISLLQHCDIMIGTRIDDPDSLKAAPICTLNCVFFKNRNGDTPVFSLCVDFSKFLVWEMKDVTI